MMRARIVWLVLGLALSAGPALAAQRIKDLAMIQGVRSNQLVGYGLVVGLDGTGDQTTQAPFTTQSMLAMLGQLGVQIPAGTNLQLKNVAAVTITATLPAFARTGQQIDVTASSIGNAKSLRGGTLLMTPLKGADGEVYAVAQGQLLVGGVGAASNGSSVVVNHLSAGRIPAGATVERVVPTSLGQGEFVHLELMQTDFTTAQRMVEAINRALGGQAARAIDGRQIQVRAPSDSNARVAFIARLENLNVEEGIESPKVIVNARTGSVVMNQLVTVAPCAVAHGNLQVTISTEPLVSQPNPAAAGQTVAGQTSDITVRSDQGRLVAIKKTTSLAEVVRALNALGANPQDLLSILQAMKAAGALKAELEII